MANILIADDSVVIRKTLRRLLVKGGHDVISEASNGEEAFGEYNCISLILLHWILQCLLWMELQRSKVL